MKRINVLDKYVSELIAAGEVVERPSSVVKELMENSIDAGATKIIVEIKNGGISLIKISDNGSGIYRDDIKNAFLRHATSKVKTSEDLDSIKTLGFRGEALASICAVSKIEVLTVCDSEEIGTRYVIEGGEEKILEDAGRAVGTTFTIKDLFFNTPARMKFLKKDVTESNSVSCIVDRISLSHPDISIKLVRDGKEIMNTQGDGQISSSIYSVYGKEIFYKMIPVDYELKGVTVKGFVGRPEASRSSRALQNFFINNRYAKLKSASAAVDEAFKGSIMIGKHPICVIYVNVPYEAVDVNVHPSKIEVRFIDERPIFEAVYYAVKSALTRDTHKKEILLGNHNKVNYEENIFSYKRKTNFRCDTENRSKFSNDKVYNGNKSRGPLLNMRASDFGNKSFFDNNRDYPSAEELRSGSSRSNIDILRDEEDEKTPKDLNINKVRTEREDNHKTPINSGEALIDTLNNSKMHITETIVNKNTPVGVISKDSDEKENINSNSQNILCNNISDKIFKNVIGEIFDCYIIVQESVDKIIFIDKHAAHERIIYNNLKKCEKSVNSQVLISPVKISLSKDEYSAIIENLGLLNNSGYIVEDFGIGTVMVRSAPVWLSISDVEGSIVEISNYILKNKTNLGTTYMEWLYDNIACRAAIKAGNKSSNEEILDLVKTLENNPDIMYCPHGRPVYISLSKKDIEKQFGRG